ncbi:leucine-rich repeat domain-containing protein, partial [Paenibacillus eucommiae]
MMLRGFSRKTGLTALSILLLLGSVMSFPVSTVQAAVHGGVFEYEDLGDGTAIITSYIGASGVDVVIPNTVGSGLIVVEIGMNAFKNKQLPSVTIPEGVTTIGIAAFAENKLTSLILPSSLTTIDNTAFMYNELATLTIPEGVTTIGTAAFEENNLTSLTLPSSLTTIGNALFKYNELATLTIPEGVTTIGTAAFEENKLTSLTLPSSLTTIDNSAFKINELATLTIPEGVTTIGPQAFEANKLTSLTLPSSLTTIDNSAFKYNELATLTIPEGVTTIGPAAFERNKLTSLTLPSSLTTIGNALFKYNELATLTIPEGVTTIGTAAFEANKLTSLTLPSSLTTIDNSAFKINELATLTIPEGVTTIGPGAFEENKLTSVMIPDSVTTIGNRAFYYNALLSDVLVLSENITFQSNQIFNYNLSNLTLYSYDSSTSKTYATVNSLHFQTITAELADLELNIPGLTFNLAERTFNLMTNANAVIVTPTPVVPFSEVKVNHTLVPYGSDSPSIDLTEGTVTITLDVEAPDNSTEQYTVVFKVDHTSPSIDLTANPTTPTNGNVTVTVGTDGTGSAIDSVKWATGSQVAAFFATGGQVLTGGSFAATVNGTYTVYARDEAGNESVEMITISNIDRNVPTINLTASPTTPTNGNVTITVGTDGTGSAIDGVKWATGSQVAAFFATGGQVLTGGSFDATVNGTYTVYARDEAGNEAVEMITISNIDRNLPTVDLTASPTSSTNGNVTVTVATYASSGISELKWAAGNEGTAFFTTDGEAIIGNEFTVTSNGTYTVYARDNAGNEAVETIAISNIDRNVPTIDLTGSPTSSTNGNVTVTMATYASSGISELKWAAGNEGTAFFATGGEAIVGNEFIVTANGTYTVYARDNAGNEAVETIAISNIDRNVPTIDLTGSPTSSTNGNVTVTVATYASSGISELRWAAGNEGTAFFATGGEAIVGNEFTVTANGTYTVYTRDNAGNEAVETIAISNIDRNVPTIDLTVSPTSSTNGNVTVTVATYASSGISE